MRIKTKLCMALISVTMMLLSCIIPTFAEEPASNETYYFDKLHKIDKDEGFSLDEEEKIGEKDVHYGWSLGALYVTGYTQRTEDKKGTPVFLKNKGDTVVLGFTLKQNINKLNKDDSLSIAADKKGYDVYFQIKKTNFKHGALIVRHTDFQNNKEEPQIYTDYLSAKGKVNANTVVEVNEEGEYEVALDYVVKNAPRKVFGKEILPSTSDYSIRLFKFKIRNGNSMAFLYDAETGSEIINKSFTENGFRIDFKNSHYLKVFVSRAAITEKGIEDTRENKPAKDGAVYTEEGIYTITVEDPATGQETIKTIYVGTDERYKAHATTGLSLEEINARLDNGETIGEDGNFVSTGTDSSRNMQSDSGKEESSGTPVIPIVAFLVIVAGVWTALSKKRKARALLKDNLGEESK